MCLAIPAKVIEINGVMGKVEIEGNVREVGLRLVPEARIGDYVLVHAGFAAEIIDPREAAATLEIIRGAYQAPEEEAKDLEEEVSGA